MSKFLIKSTFIVAAMTLISRIFGFIRDMVTAYAFGAGLFFDAFTVAFRIPNFMRRLFAEGSFSQAFVPVLAEYQKKESEQTIRAFIDATAGGLALASGIVSMLGILFAPYLIDIFSPGFIGTSRYDLSVQMLRITFPYLMFISLTAFCGAILNSYNRFWVAAFTPVFLNIFMILAALCLSPYLSQPIVALAWGVFIAGIAQFLFPLSFLKKMNLLPTFRINFQDPGVRRILKMIVPALFGVSVGQINLLVDSVFASFLEVGSVSWLYYSDRLMEFPLGVFGVAISTVILPQLSKHHALTENMHFSLTIDWAMRAIFLVGLPALVCLSVIAKPILSSLFQYGEFTFHSVEKCSLSLAAFAIGITPFMLVKVLASGFYAKQDLRTPVMIGACMVIANILFNFLFIPWFKHAGVALATSCSAILNASFLLYVLKKRNWFSFREGSMLFYAKTILAAIVLSIWFFLFRGEASFWANGTFVFRMGHLLLLTGSGALIYFICLYVLGIRKKDVLVPHEAA